MFSVTLVECDQHGVLKKGDELSYFRRWGQEEIKQRTHMHICRAIDKQYCVEGLWGLGGQEQDGGINAKKGDIFNTLNNIV